MAATALGLALALFLVFDFVADLIDLSKGASFGWAFAMLGLTAVLAVGALIEFVVLIVSRVMNLRKARG
ncbi:MAG: hypothetical protein EDM03_01240 [Porphyrobacter sp. IPPAS B-1204]|nr:MAG: hypothetical protein EDM03_01240 [Porphyrobacter sp. IPPAS B-1204]